MLGQRDLPGGGAHLFQERDFVMLRGNLLAELRNCGEALLAGFQLTGSRGPGGIDQTNMIAVELARLGRRALQCRAQGEGRIDFAENGFRVARFGQDIDNATAAREGLRLSLVVGGGVEDDRHVVALAVFAQPPDELEAIDRRHQNVADHEVRVVLRDLGQRLVSIGRPGDVVTV